MSITTIINRHLKTEKEFCQKINGPLKTESHNFNGFHGSYFILHRLFFLEKLANILIRVGKFNDKLQSKNASGRNLDPARWYICSL